MPETGDSRYDRALLLGRKRNDVLDLAEIRRYGAESFGDPDYLRLYGLAPAEWFDKGIRVLGRTAVECTRDVLGDAIGRDIADIAAGSQRRCLVLDPFAGSGNTLFWMLRHLTCARGVGFELDPRVFELTRRNLALLGLPIDIAHIDYVGGLQALSIALEDLVVAFIAPPWGDALDAVSGLDLARTTPPVAQVVERLEACIGPRPMLCAIQIHESVTEASMGPLKQRCSWWQQRRYDLSAPGQRHGLLIGTRGWSP